MFSNLTKNLSDNGGAGSAGLNGPLSVLTKSRYFPLLALFAAFGHIPECDIGAFSSGNGGCNTDGTDGFKAVNWYPLETF